MTVLAIMATAATVLLLGGRFYAPVIGRVLGERPDRVTPAVRINDGRDYVPTRTPIVFAHHYASIAGAGPIIGPVVAILYGWGPALIWILLGGVFLGAVHDFAATHIAMREGGKNLTVIARRYIGPGAFVMMLFLLIALLALVCAAFLDLSATALTSKVAISDLQMESGQTVFREVTTEHVITKKVEPHAIIGGVASTSVVVITACSPLLGFLYLRRKWPVWLCSCFVQKRYGFRGGPATHGSMSHRRPGSSGGTDGARVFKGTKKPGHMGNVRKTVQRLRVHMVNADKNLLVVEGAVPGANRRLVTVWQPAGSPAYAAPAGEGE